ncbi:MAG TPA: hypothetical protein VIU12_33060 [Chryseolinea sp.]
MNDKAFDILIECEDSLLLENVDHETYDYDEELESITSLFHDLSVSFNERRILFTLKINNAVCAADNTELSILLEKFMSLVDFATSEEIKNYNLDFFEQGAVYLLSFEKSGKNLYSLQFTNKQIPNFEVINCRETLLDLNLTLFTFYHRVVFLTAKMCPAISKHKMYVDWRSRIDQMFQLSNIF